MTKTPSRPRGTIFVTSGQIRVSDPCSPGSKTGDYGVFDSHNGAWSVRRCNGRMVAQHKSMSLKAYGAKFNFYNDYYDTEVLPVEVDSGQISIIDESLYPEHETGDFHDRESFYGAVCEMTLSGCGFGEVRGGYAARTIDGDGRYYTRVYFYNGRAFRLEVAL